eukprot:2650303-Rhodomonas_salina.1
MDTECTIAFHKWLLDLCVKSVCLMCEGTIAQFRNVVAMYTNEPISEHEIQGVLKTLRRHEVCTRHDNDTYSININLLRAHRFDLYKRGLYAHMRDIIATAQYARFLTHDHEHIFAQRKYTLRNLFVLNTSDDNPATVENNLSPPRITKKVPVFTPVFTPVLHTSRASTNQEKALKL